METPQKLTQKQSQGRTRIAPSPTGYLHLGHAYSVWLTLAIAKHQNLEVITRIENIDHTRCKPEYVEAIPEDLTLLGYTPQQPIWHQSERFEVYAEALEALGDFMYPCTCTRADLQDYDSATYPGLCRGKLLADIPEGTPYALRLNLDKAKAHLEVQSQWPLTFNDATQGTVTATPEIHGDVVLARKEFKTSYHLSVVVDDAAQGITHIIRGADLYDMTHIHRVLQALLGLPTPQYMHHGLIAEHGNEKLSKSAASMPLRTHVKNGLDLAALKHVFDEVKTLADEPAERFIEALPDDIAAPLEFKAFI